MFKKCNVVMLPTNEKASLCISQDKLTRFHGIEPDNEILVYRHLYIVSDDKIEEGDLPCYIYHRGMKSIQNISMVNALKEANEEGNKIISTTDTTIKVRSEQAGDNTWFNPYPKPSDSFIAKFIEEYNKDNIIIDIMVEYEQTFEDNLEGREFVLRPVGLRLKVNSKDNTITIRKVKDSWNREEVGFLIDKAVRPFLNYTFSTEAARDEWLYNWLKENL